MYTEIPISTFGPTPGAEYLCRTLNEVGSELLLRSVGKQISSTAKLVKELVFSYQYGYLSPKTLANTLRLLREEVKYSANYAGTDKEYLVDQLRRNVQIGFIKRGLRVASIGRKAEHVMDNPYKRGVSIESANHHGTTIETVSFNDQQFGYFVAGKIFKEANELPVVVTSKFNAENVDVITPGVLHARSQARCERLNKNHIKEKNEQKE